MARNKYGKTWWGQAWVQAMERIDSNTNRLPRGRTYANKGYVSHMQVEEGNVTAFVQGTRRDPYRVSFHLMRFTKNERDRAIDSIKDDPFLKAQLALGRLPQEVLELLKSHKIHLLPVSWKDLKASCSCPDWANPCKHLAAVYYLLANEIDQEPFVLFQLRGMEKEELMGEELVKIEKEETGFIPYKTLAITGDDGGELPSLQFSQEKGKAIFSLLLADCTFYQGNFKDELLKNYRYLSKELDRLDLLEDELPFYGEQIALFLPEHESILEPLKPEIFLYPVQIQEDPPQGERRVVRDLLVQEEKTLQIHKRVGSLQPLSSFLLQLLRTPLSQAKEYSLSLSFLIEASAVAQSMIQSFLFLPFLKRDEEGNFSIIYLPNLHTGDTYEAIDYLTKNYPANLIQTKNHHVLPPLKGVEKILSILLTEIVHQFSPYQLQLMGQVFFQGKEYRVEGFSGSQMANAVSHWLSLLHVPARSISPLLQIEPNDSNHYSLQVLVENREDPLDPLLTLEEVFASSKEIFSLPAPEVQSQVSCQLTFAADIVVSLREILSSKGQKEITMDGKEMYYFIENLQGILNILGMRVILPKEMQRIYEPKISMKVEGEERLSYFNLDEALHFSWQIALGDMVISKEEFTKLSSSAAGIVRFRDSYILLDPQKAMKIISQMEKPLPSLNSFQVLQGALKGEIEDIPFFPGENLRSLIDDLERIPLVEEPEGLLGELRPYQLRGYQWLYANISRGFGICLADDMGLGKTIQTLSLILKMKEEDRLTKPALIICPTTLVGNWYKEVERFTPSLNSYIYHGQDRRLQIKGFDVIITTYGLIRQEPNRFRTKEWSLIIIDEAQNIKNHQSQQAKAVKSLKGEGYLALTGTPVENRLTELWSIFDFINKGYLGSRKGFITRYALPIERYRNQVQIETLKKITSPFLMRRMKSDKKVISDLPPKVVENEYCSLTTQQVFLYKQVVEKNLQIIETKEGIERKGLVFQLITSLKQICNHPVQYSKKGAALMKHSGKALRTIALLKEILDKNEKVLLFTQYKEMGNLLLSMIEEELLVKPIFFHGSLNRNKREELITSFQEGPSSILIISLKAGGTGLNLTAASHVIHYDLWWNPAVEEQATDRSYRIGQHKRVFLKRLITMGTFEEKIDDIISKKKELADLTIASGEKWLTEFSNKDLKELFTLTSS